MKKFILTLVFALAATVAFAGDSNTYPGTITATTSYIAPNTSTSTDGKYAFSANCYKLCDASAETIVALNAQDNWRTFGGSLTAGVTFNPLPKYGNMYKPYSMTPLFGAQYPYNGWAPYASDTPAFRTKFVWTSDLQTGTAERFENGFPVTYTVKWKVRIVVTGNWYFDGLDWWFVLDDTLDNTVGNDAIANPYIDDQFEFVAYTN